MISAIARFLSVALNRGDWKQAGEVFSTALVVNALVVILQVPLYIIGVWKLEWLIDFPPEQSLDFRILVICNVLTFLATVLVYPFGSTIQATNRLDIGSKVEIVLTLLRLGLLYVLITQIGARLWIIGVVDLGVGLVSAAVTYMVSRRLGPGLSFCWSLVSRKWIKPVMGMAGWILVAEIGQLLFTRTDVWIINKFVDINLAGVCAALLVWPNFIQQIAKSVSSVFMPVILIEYAKNKFQRIRDIVLFLSDTFNFLALLACGGVMLAGEPLLDLWMGEGASQYNNYLILMLLHYPLTLNREAMWLAFPAFNKMHYVGISNIVGGVLNISLSLLAASMGFGLVGVIIATGLSLMVQRTLFLSLFSAKLLGFKYRVFMGGYLSGATVYLLFLLQMFDYIDIDVKYIGIIAVFLAVVRAVHVAFSSNLSKVFWRKLGMYIRRFTR